MRIHFDPKGDLEWLSQHLKKCENANTCTGVLLMIAEDTALRLGQKAIDELLCAFKKPIFGGVFPALIYNAHRFDEGTVAICFESALKTMVIDTLDSQEALVAQINKTFEEGHKAYDTRMLFIDGLSDHISRLVDDLFYAWGAQGIVLGGGCGSKNFTPMASVVTNSGLKSNVAVLTTLKKTTYVGVAHGWQPISAPMKVTKALDNIIYELNGHKAFDVYAQFVSAHVGQEMTPDNFLSYAQAYPLGMSKLLEDMVVRDIIGTDGSHLISVGEVPSQVYVHILHGSSDQLISGAQKAVTKAVQYQEQEFMKIQNNMTRPEKPHHEGLLGQISGFEPVDESSELQNFVYDALVFDCLTRATYLEEHFDSELKAIYTVVEKSHGFQGGATSTLVGALTIGEIATMDDIANMGPYFLEFHNKTAVIGLFKRH